MRRKHLRVSGWIVVWILVAMTGYVVAEEITMTTYYPSPRGVYDDLQSNSLSVSGPISGTVITGTGLNCPNCVGSGEIAANSVGASEIIDGQVFAAEIATGAVGNLQLGPNAVDTNNIIDGEVKAVDIGTGEVGSSEIAAGAVGFSELSSTKGVTVATYGNGTGSSYARISIDADGRVTAGSTIPITTGASASTLTAGIDITFTPAGVWNPHTSGPITIDSTAGGGGIGGSGIDNYVPLWNGSNALDTSTIRQSTSGNRIGINSPSSPLIDLSISDNDTGFDVPSGGTLNLYSNGGPRMTIRDTNGGSVGIGTTSPTAKLHVVQINASDALRVDDVAGDTTPFVINSFGDVGIGTSNPVSAFHVYNNDNANDHITVSGLAPSIKFRRGGFTTDRGVIGLADQSNRFVFGSTQDDFVIQTSGKLMLSAGGNKAACGGLPCPGLVIREDGQVGINVDPNTGYARLQVGGAVEVRTGTTPADPTTGGPTYYLRNTNSGVLWQNEARDDGNLWWSAASGGVFVSRPGMQLSPDGSLWIAGVAARPGGGSWVNFSDVRLKKNVEPLGGALEKMLRLRGVTYEWKEPEKMGNLTGTQMGMIAGEVEQVFPEWISTNDEGYKMLGFRGFEAMTVEAIRELKDENNALKLHNRNLESRLEVLESRN